MIRKLNVTTKLTLVVGLISSLVACLAIIFIINTVFTSTESNIKNELSNHHLDIVPLANAKKSTELANYLRSNDLSLFIFDDNKQTIARYGIYRNLDEKTLLSFTSLPSYTDKNILDYGEYDIYTKDNIQIATKNHVLFVLKNSFYISLVTILPIAWIVAAISAIYATKIILSPLQRAKDISHELKTPLTRVVSTLQVLIDDVPKSIKGKLKDSASELILLGENVDSILSLSSLGTKTFQDVTHTNLSREIKKYLTDIPSSIKLRVSISPSVVIPLNSSFVNIIFRNLLNNAVKYNTSGGFINVISKKNSNGWFLDIANSTSYKNKVKGYGLGMTIVQDICHNQNLKCKISNKNNIFNVRIEGSLIKSGS